MEAGNRLADAMNLKGAPRQEFLVGCLIPDINNGYINNPKTLKEHRETHYAYDQKSSLNFYAENRDEIQQKSPIYLGYLFHLYTDGFFNYDFYRSIKRSPLGEGKTHDEKADIKHHDFWLYDTNFHHELNLTAKEAAIIARKASEIKAVDITAEDLLEVAAILRRTDLNDNIKNDTYLFYTKASLDNLLEDMLESFTNDYLKGN